MAAKAGRVQEPIIALSPEEENIIFKSSHLYLALSILTFLAGIALGYMIWGSGLLPRAGSNSVAAAQAEGLIVEAPEAAQPRPIRYKIPTAGFYSLGPADAPIAIVEFGDYQCEYCRQWHQEVYKELFAAYPGKIRLVFRNFPQTSLHPDAMSAAEAALCAGEQNTYWQYHDKLFSSETLGRKIYLQYAWELNLNLSTFEDCLDHEKFKANIQSDRDFALNLGAHYTPTFFINGLAVVGTRSLEYFKQMINQELVGKIPQ